MLSRMDVTPAADGLCRKCGMYEQAGRIAVVTPMCARCDIIGLFVQYVGQAPPTYLTL